ncbi:CobW family GTP-binding protein [Xanthomarina sp. F2636L]|uniref:CobW family GTP-binding protein n=1 Tax=Xanthomarina sp. F2636L TaxID=2996018 RepID=UPI00225E3ECF|nr:GTP-binding protein [Xanthomarina sp. F2636L]MCX7549473.1 GTP-binding protein [Xanthomarina sp. F2636L]
MHNKTYNVGLKQKLIPVTIIGGFLGSGKTTLLNYILSENHGVRAAVLVNDFGAINIDAKLVVGVEGETVELANGCVCCTIRDDLAGACIDLLKRPDMPEHVFIELSGVSHPIPVLNTILDIELSTPFGFNCILSIVDSEQFSLMKGNMAKLAQSQIGAADIVVFNKVDLVNQEQLTHVKNIVKKLTSGAKIVEVVQGRIPMELILPNSQSIPPIERVKQSKDNYIHVHGHGLATWSWTTDQQLSLHKFRSVISTLSETIYRCKGIVCLEELPMYRYIIQMVGKRLVITEDELWGEEAPISELVLIGDTKDIKPKELKQHFDACIGTGDESQSAVLRLAKKLNYIN